MHDVKLRLSGGAGRAQRRQQVVSERIECVVPISIAQGNCAMFLKPLSHRERGWGEGTV